MLLGGNYFIIVLTMKLLVLLTRLKIEIVGFQSVIVKRNNVAATEVLVQWQHHPKEDATWEDCYSLKSRFPYFKPRGQGWFLGPGN